MTSPVAPPAPPIGDLHARLAAIGADEDLSPTERRARALAELKAALSAGRAELRQKLETSAGQGGLATGRALAALTDRVVTALYAFTTTAVFPSDNPTQAEKIALLAVGGYGRGALAPFSDIDLLFLRPYKPTAHGESVIEYMLYALWDLGFKVGQASRTIDETLKLSREDFTIRTALVDARLLAGDADLFADMVKRFRGEVTRNTGPEFVAAKLAERDERHARTGASRYMVEPNVKEGKGGLRDLHTLFWIAKYLHPDETRAAAFEASVFGPKESQTFGRAFDFLWTVRCHLHFTTGRAEERLSFDLQPEIARRMGYGDRGDAPAVERFMRRYFMVAKDVGSLTRTFCAKLEDEQTKTRPQGLSRFLPAMRPVRKLLDVPGFHVEGGRLNVDGAEVFQRDPVNLLRLFQIADSRDLDLHPDAFTAVTRSWSLIRPALRRDPEAVRVFLDTLARGKRVFRTLTLMTETGVLGRFIPEFGRITAQMQFNMYHAYTVDEHTLRAVEVLADIAAGRLDEDHPLSVEIFPLIEDPEALFLAMLLHDTGKGGEGGQETAGARVARAVGKRMGLAPDRVELIAWLIENHLLMSDVAQKRDIGDPATVEAFARKVETPEHLRLLLVLTVADIRAVGPGVWNGWKGQLMRELYAATEAVFRGVGRADGQRDAADIARARLIQASPDSAAWAASMTDAYFATVPAAEQGAHAALVRLAKTSDAPAVSAAIRPDYQAAQITVATVDRRGLFADLAGALSAHGGNVVGARAYTAADGGVLDIFFVQDSFGGPYGEGEPARLDRLVRAMTAAAAGETLSAPHTPALGLGRAAAFSITPMVVIDNEASKEATVVEASGRDRPGLLSELARALAAAGASIQSAHIENYGERAVDAFYVTGPEGEKLNPAQAGELKAALISVLSDEPAQTPARARMARARASVAR